MKHLKHRKGFLKYFGMIVNYTLLFFHAQDDNVDEHMDDDSSVLHEKGNINSATAVLY